MAAPTEPPHVQHIRVRNTQLEIPSGAGHSRSDDYDDKLQAAQRELERIQQEQEQLARKKQELEELTARKRSFITQQIEMTEKLGAALTMIDRELYDLRQEAEDLEQCRVCFASHMDKLQKLNPEQWQREQLHDKLEKAAMALDIAADEYDQAATHFEGSRSGAIFGRASSKRGRGRARSAAASEFSAQLRNGFAFNLPVVALGVVALLVYLVK
jgi:chromosome segregation ATPase